jgi:preprotein translocase subunit SecG
MIYGLLSTLFVILCFLLLLIILLQKSKGSLGILGGVGGSAQMLFGGSGGQDLFQKITWIFVALFLAGSLVLALLKEIDVNSSKYLDAMKQPVPQLPVTQSPLQGQVATIPSVPVSQPQESQPEKKEQIPTEVI